MLRHLLKTDKIANKSEHNAVRKTAISETFSKRHDSNVSAENSHVMNSQCRFCIAINIRYQTVCFSHVLAFSQSPLTSHKATDRL